MPSLADLTNPGIAPYGLRHSGQGVKGHGYFGALPSAGGVSTEISSERDGLEYPLMVPTLSLAELQHLLGGGRPTPEIYDKAESHARMRLQKGMNPFAGPTDLRYPMPSD